MELEQVVGGGDELPFGSGSVESAAAESSEATSVFDVAEDGLDGVLPFAVKGLALDGA
jgi:hypothetical protein